MVTSESPTSTDQSTFMFGLQPAQQKRSKIFDVVTFRKDLLAVCKS